MISAKISESSFSFYVICHVDINDIIEEEVHHHDVPGPLAGNGC